MKLPRLSRGAEQSGPGEGWSDHDEDSTARVLEGAAGFLSPDEAALSRMHAVSRQSFREAGYRQSAAAPRRSLRPVRRLRLAAAFSVALLMLTGTGVVAAAESGPGQPFYRTRLAVEAFFLPGAGTPERLAADLDRAQARLDEAVRAAAAGDANAEGDALGAYADVMGSIAVPNDEAARRQLTERLDQQLAELQRLQAQSGDRAAEDLDRAMRRLGQVLAGAGQQQTPSAGPTGQGSGSTPSGETGSSGGGPKASPSGGGDGSGDGGGDGGGGGPNPSASPSGPGPGGQETGAGGSNESPGPKKS